MSLATPNSIRTLQRKLYLKAKREPAYRFYSLYDKVYRKDILEHAYACAKSNRGAPGVDGMDFADIESYGRKRFLAELGVELQERRYRPEAVRRVMIPKPNGGTRPLGIPTVKDRIVQTAVKIVLEPIFEADFTDNAYGYRPNRDAKQAVQEVHRTLKAGHWEVVEADLSKYFDEIPHADLMRSVARRVSDGALLHLIKIFLKVQIEEKDEEGKRRRQGPGSRGTPQGGVISPLMANIYMRRFLVAWEQRGHEYDMRVVNYADDLVILCRKGAAGALEEARDIFTRMGLRLNEQKSKVCHVWQEPFDFLGYTFGTRYLFGSGQRYLAAYPSKQSERKLRQKLRRMIGSHMTWQSEENIARNVNRVLRGWANYFDYGKAWKTFNRVERFVDNRIRGWLRRKHKVASRGYRQYPSQYIYEKMGVLNLSRVLLSPRTP